MGLRDNRGLSLLELIMAISIVAILATGTLGLFGRLGTADTAKAAKEIDTAMERVRMETMCRCPKPYLYLYCIGNYTYLKLSTEADPLAAALDVASGIKLDNYITISYKKATGTEQSLNTGGNISISFQRSSGAFDQDYEYIKIQGTNHAVLITCIPETGRHWTD